jgi:hypothetical protein
MPLNKNILGSALYNAEKKFNDKDIDQLIEEYGSLEAVREEFWKVAADEIIKHLKSDGVLRVPGTGLIAPTNGGPVSGTSVTGKIE